MSVYLKILLFPIIPKHDAYINELMTKKYCIYPYLWRYNVISFKERVNLMFSMLSLRACKFIERGQSIFDFPC